MERISAAAVEDLCAEIGEPCPVKLCAAAAGRYAGKCDYRYLCGFMLAITRAPIPDRGPLSGPFRAGYADGRRGRRRLCAQRLRYVPEKALAACFGALLFGSQWVDAVARLVAG